MILHLLFIFGMCVLIRTIKTVQKLNEFQGRKFITGILIAADTVVFLLVFKAIITDVLTVPIVSSMALGYLTGYYIGAFIEERMALGQVIVTIKIAKEHSKTLFKILNKEGFIFTRSKRVYDNKNKPQKIYEGLIFRKELSHLKSVLKDLDFIAYIKPIKSTFGQKPLTRIEYLKLIEIEEED